MCSRTLKEVGGMPQVAAQRSALTQLLDRFFGGQPELLVQNLLDNEELSKAEIRRLKKLIQKEDARA